MRIVSNMSESSNSQSLGSLLERSGPTTYVLGVLYFVALLYATRRFWKVYSRTRRLDIPHLFLASIVFGLIVRSFGCITLAVLTLLNVNVSTTSNAVVPISQQQRFYQHALAVFFNMGDWAAISAYLLLIVVWVEIFQRGKRHYYNVTNIRRGWLIAYLTVNVCLYLVQLGLYAGVFTLESQSDAIIDLIYIVIAVLNFLIPVVLLVASIVYTLSFAGFPFVSARAKSDFRKVNNLVRIWTFGRVLWGVLAVLASQRGMAESIANYGDWLFGLVFGTLFIVAELLPFVFSMGSDVLALFQGDLRNRFSVEISQEDEASWSLKSAPTRQSAAEMPYSTAALPSNASALSERGRSTSSVKPDLMTPNKPSPAAASTASEGHTRSASGKRQTIPELF